MSKLFPWSLCRVVWVCLWEDCCWAWMQGVSPPVSHGLSLFGLLCSCSVTCWTSGFPHAHFFPHIGSLSKSCYWPIQSFQWVKRFDLSSQGYWLRDCRMTSGRKIFVWQCLLWSHPSNHQSLFRGKVQNSNLVSPLLGYFLEEGESLWEMLLLSLLCSKNSTWWSDHWKKTTSADRSDCVHCFCSSLGAQ